MNESQINRYTDFDYSSLSNAPVHLQLQYENLIIDFSTSHLNTEKETAQQLAGVLSAYPSLLHNKLQTKLLIQNVTKLLKSTIGVKFNAALCILTKICQIHGESTTEPFRDDILHALFNEASSPKPRRFHWCLYNLHKLISQFGRECGTDFLLEVLIFTQTLHRVKRHKLQKRLQLHNYKEVPERKEDSLDWDELCYRAQDLYVSPFHVAPAPNQVRYSPPIDFPKAKKENDPVQKSLLFEDSLDILRSLIQTGSISSNIIQDVWIDVIQDLDREFDPKVLRKICLLILQVNQSYPSVFRGYVKQNNFYELLQPLPYEKNVHFQDCLAHLLNEVVLYSPFPFPFDFFGNFLQMGLLKRKLLGTDDLNVTVCGLMSSLAKTGYSDEILSAGVFTHLQTLLNEGSYRVRSAILEFLLHFTNQVSPHSMIDSLCTYSILPTVFSFLELGDGFDIQFSEEILNNIKTKVSLIDPSHKLISIIDSMEGAMIDDL